MKEFKQQINSELTVLEREVAEWNNIETKAQVTVWKFVLKYSCFSFSIPGLYNLDIRINLSHRIYFPSKGPCCSPDLWSVQAQPHKAKDGLLEQQKWSLQKKINVD